MSFFVHSDDYKSGGSSSNGVWSFARSLRGNWSVIGQHMDTQTFPWLTSSTNVMIMRIHDPMDTNVYTTFEITFPTSIGLQSDIATIANMMTAEMQDSIDTIAGGDPYAARLVSNSVDVNNQIIVFHFDDDPVDILWEGVPDVFESTINAPLGKSGASNQLNVEDLTLTTHHMVTDPKYLEVYIEESNTQFATSHDTRPTLLFSTRDGDFTGQTFSIPKDGNTLTIQINKMGDSTALPLTGAWFLVLQSSA